MSPLIPRKKTLAILAVIIMGAALAAAYYLWRVPIDITSYKGAIISRIEDVTGANLTAGSARLGLLPAPYLEARDVHMSKGNKSILDARAVRLHISILPLFLRKIVVERMSMEGWRLAVLRRPDGSMPLREIYERVIKRRHMVTVKSMALADGVLVVEDRMGERDFMMKAVMGRGRVERHEDAIRFQANLGLEDGTEIFTRCEVTKPEGRFRLRGSATVADMDLARLKSYVKHPTLSGRASTDLDFTYEDGLRARGRINYRDITMLAPQISARPLRSGTGTADFRLGLREKDIELEIRKAEVDMDDYVVSGEADLKGDLEKPSTLALDLRLQSTPIPAKTVKTLVMDRVFKDKKIAWINEVQPLGGAVSVKAFHLKATMGAIGQKGSFTRPGVMRLEAGLEGLRFRHKILGPEEVSNLFGKLLITGGTIDFKDVSGRVGTGLVERLSYRMENIGAKNKHLTYDLSLLGHMDAGRAIGLTIRLFRNSGEAVKKQLRRISATGDTRVKFILKGTMDVKGSSKFSVNLGFRKATFRYDGFPLSFTSLDGNIDIDNRRFTFTDLFMRDGADSSMALNGYIRDYTGPTPYLSLDGKGSIYGGTLSAFFTGTTLEGLSTVDAVPFSARVKGPLEDLRVKYEADLGPAGIGYRALLGKKAGVPLSLTTELLIKKNTIEIKKTDLKTLATSIRLKGTMGRGKRSGSYNIFVEARKARLYDLADITPLVDKRADTAGTLNIILKAWRKSRGAAPIYKGVISLEKGHFTSPLAAEPVKSLEIFAELDGRGASIRIPKAKIGTSEFQGSIKVPSIARKKMEMNFVSRRLDTSDIWGEGTEALADWSRRIRDLGLEEKRKNNEKPLTGTGKISIKSGRVLGTEVKDFKSEILMSPQFIRLDPIVFITKGGTVKGKSVLFREQTSPHTFEGSASLTGIHLKELLRDLGAKKDILTGDLYGNIEISCRRGTKPFSRCLDGKAFVKAEHGRMWKFQVISKIFSIVNIISIDELFKRGLPYRSITGDFKIKKGVITTDDLLFDSDSMRMSAVISLDTTRKTIDSTLGVHPFVTIDKIVTNIPLVGWIIGGKEKSSVSLYYTIKGPLKTPSVEPARIKNIQKGILGKIERLITSPIKVIQMGSDILVPKDKGEDDEK